MPRETSTAARILVPVVALLVMVGVGIAFWKSTFASKPGAPASTPAAPAQPAAPQPGPSQPAPTQPEAPKSPSPEAPPPATAPGALPAVRYRALSMAGDGLATNLAPMGTLERSKDDRTRMRVEFSSTGAGIRSVQFAEYFESIQRTSHYAALEELHHDATLADGRVVRSTLTPMAALYIKVDGQVVILAGTPGEPAWRQVSAGEPGRFEAFVVDEGGTRVLRIERRYEKAPGSFTLRITQSIQNLGAAPLRVQWCQLGPADLPTDKISYMGDRRRLHFGYLMDATRDPTRSVVLADAFMIPHDAILGPRGGGGAFAADAPQWPNDTSRQENYSLVWAGLTNRYFGVAVMPAAGADKALAWVGGVGRVVLDKGFADKVDASVAALRLDGAERALAARGTLDVSCVVFVGPLDAHMMQKDPALGAMGLAGMVVHNIGGPCAFCTFGWMTDLLLWLMRTLHDNLVFDWGLAIILLVVVVRTCLHPVTKWSQIRMTRFGKQMQGIQPKIKVLQEKYAGDKAKLQQETARLWREEGVNPAQMLGCLPMFLQTPVWFALSATLFLAVELRHQPAFFGVFQKVQGASSPFWWFLGDLAEPDRLWLFARPFVIPLVGWQVSSLNILPLLLGVVFFIQQKYLQPPTAATLTPEQQTQQNIVKWMSVLMFPLMMYPAPAGLTLYFTTNSLLSIAENRYIRSHINKYEAEHQAKVKAKKGQGGFMQRLMAAAEARRQMLEQAKKGRK